MAATSRGSPLFLNANNFLSNDELLGHVELSVNLDDDLVVHFTILGSNVLDDIHL